MARIIAPRVARMFGCMMAAALVAGSVASAAWAQPVPQDRDRLPKTETEGQAPPGSADPSERLDRSKGVIRPPQGIDPNIQVPAPDPGSQKTPVIPPPGTPGGDQTVEPK